MVTQWHSVLARDIFSMRLRKFNLQGFLQGLGRSWINFVFMTWYSVSERNLPRMGP